MSLTIRPATRDDAALILRFITDLAIYEKAEHEVKTDAAGIENSLFADDSTAHGLICERGGEPIGYAVYFFNYSTWLGRNGLYLEDLYVTPEARGTGAGFDTTSSTARSDCFVIFCVSVSGSFGSFASPASSLYDNR